VEKSKKAGSRTKQESERTFAALRMAARTLRQLTTTASNSQESVSTTGRHLARSGIESQTKSGVMTQCETMEWYL
jgi:hypothetical protein